MRNKIFLIWFMVFSLLNGGTDGTIRGKVTDIEGVPMAGANIYIPSIGIGAAADADGNYIILNIPVDDYDVIVQMMGYKKQTIKEVRVMMDQTVWLNFTLEEETVEGEEVVVLGERPLVERGTTSKKVTVGKEAIQSLPIRDLTVIGISTAFRMVRTIVATKPGSSIRQAPNRPDCTRSLGQPTLMLTSS